MWSGPRNISTALMRAWENRPDTAVIDEPFYAFYLAQTGIDHPGREKIIASYENDWRLIVADITGKPPSGASIYYQKHMTHHMIPAIPLDWLEKVANCFLIRDPREVISSYIQVRSEPTMDDLGYRRQHEIFEHVRRRLNPHPPVLDSSDVLQDPGHLLERLCDRLGVPFDPDHMLNWPAGRRPSDGLWGRFWYGSVERSTGFLPYLPRERKIPEHLEWLCDACEEYYREMYRYRLTA